MEESSLRQVFEICDDKHTGAISPDRIIELARRTSIGTHEEAIKRLRDVLSQCGKDSVSYEEFRDVVNQVVSDGGDDCHGLVRRMSQSQQSTITDNGFANLKLEEAGIGGPDHLQPVPSMDESSLTYNEYDYSTIPDDDTMDDIGKSNISKRESISSDVAADGSLASKASFRQAYKDDLIDYSRRLQEDAVSELADKVHSLKDEITSISQERFSQTERLHRVQNENTELRNRLMIVEERLQDVENVAGGHPNMDDSSFIHKIIDKYENSLNDEKELLQRRMSKFESELSKTKEENQLIKLDVAKLTNRFEQLDSQLRDSEEAYESLRAQHAELLESHNDRLHQLEENSKTIRPLQMTSQLSPDDASPSLVKNDCSSSDGNFLTTMIQQLRDDLENLKEENAKLREENKKLLAQRDDLPSLDGRLSYEDKPWATELDMMTKEELQGKVQDLLSENSRYRVYVERINARILQEYPDLLENVDVNR